MNETLWLPGLCREVTSSPHGWAATGAMGKPLSASSMAGASTCEMVHGWVDG